MDITRKVIKHWITTLDKLQSGKSLIRPHSVDPMAKWIIYLFTFSLLLMFQKQPYLHCDQFIVVHKVVIIERFHCISWLAVVTLYVVWETDSGAQ